MAEEFSQKYCQTCGGMRRFSRPKTNHILHLLITLFLCGLWIPVWIIIAFTRPPARCTNCGGK